MLSILVNAALLRAEDFLIVKEFHRVDGIDGGREDYSNSGGVSGLCIWYSSAAHISLR